MSIERKVIRLPLNQASNEKKKKDKKKKKRRLVVAPKEKELIKEPKKPSKKVKLKKPSKNLVLAVTYNVWISGKKLALAKKQCISSIEIKETVEGADSAVLEIQDPEFRYIEDNLFVEDHKIKIHMGWAGLTYRVKFEGYISSLDINFNNDGIPKLTITCMDKTHKMNRKKKNKTFKNTTSAAVVKKIVGSYGFTCKVDPSYKFEKQETITQSNQSDIEFITKLAGDEVHPFTARLVGNKFYYEKMGKLKTPKMKFAYRVYPHDIISFSLKINKESKQVEIKGASINTSNKVVSSTTGTSSGNGRSGSATSNGNTSSNRGSESRSSGNKSGSDKSSGSYTYNPESRKWHKN